jgi:hypothetical protein
MAFTVSNGVERTQLAKVHRILDEITCASARQLRSRRARRSMLLRLVDPDSCRRTRRAR